MPFLTIDNPNETIHLHYQDFGIGDPIVLIHGWPLNSRSWEAQVYDLVKAGYRVIAYDRRGFGHSTHPWENYNYDAFAADLNELMEYLDLQDATLVGFSMGGGEVARYLSKYGSARVAKAVFAAAVPPYLYQTDGHQEGAIDESMIHEFEEGIKKDRPAFIETFIKKFFSASVMGEKVSDAQHDFHKELALFASPKATLDCISAFSRTDFREDLKKITIPTLVIHGDSDSIVPFENSGKLTNEMIKGSEVVLIKGGPHGVNLTHKEEFNKALIKFLSRGSKLIKPIESTETQRRSFT